MWPGPECLVPAVTVAPMDRLPLLLMMGKSSFTVRFILLVHFFIRYQLDTCCIKFKRE